MLFIVCCFCYAFVTFINVVFVFFVDVFAVSVTVATYKFIFLNSVGFVLFCFVFSILAVPFLSRFLLTFYIVSLALYVSSLLSFSLRPLVEQFLHRL